MKKHRGWIALLLAAALMLPAMFRTPARKGGGAFLFAAAARGLMRASMVLFQKKTKKYGYHIYKIRRKRYNIDNTWQSQHAFSVRRNVEGEVCQL